ncbi:hypothetical protein BV509_10665 [Rhodovulum sulfidophilum]|nr:hypothetical protein BV509_10665 [Rhodovulum sulfidophilum]
MRSKGQPGARQTAKTASARAALNPLWAAGAAGTGTLAAASATGGQDVIWPRRDPDGKDRRGQGGGGDGQRWPPRAADWRPVRAMPR